MEKPDVKILFKALLERHSYYMLIIPLVGPIVILNCDILFLPSCSHFLCSQCSCNEQKGQTAMVLFVQVNSSRFSFELTIMTQRSWHLCCRCFSKPTLKSCFPADVLVYKMFTRLCFQIIIPDGLQL
jgi:hypothetical protein